MGSLLFLSACQHGDRRIVDKLNNVSYAYHYRNLDSTWIYANRADSLSSDYDAGRAEALNNKAFVCLARMEYDEATRLLAQIQDTTDNQLELLVADIQQMRLCQRKSNNREYYDHSERANSRLNRIIEDQDELSDRQKRRLVYAQSELAIVNSTYYYYVGLDRLSKASFKKIDEIGELQHDSAQYLNYLYNIGAGGIVEAKTQDEVVKREFDCLIKCLAMAVEGKYDFFIANALEALSEHLQDDSQRLLLMDYSPASFVFLNPESLPTNLLAGNLAEQSLNIFSDYGDTYQIAGAERTLASCYMAIGDYYSALQHLEYAIADSAINQAPDLVASIREKMSIAYSAIDDKQASDYNRNIYLDMQEQTRQDRYFEARADQLDKESAVLSEIVVAIIVAIVLLVFLLWLFNHLYRQKMSAGNLDALLNPLREWKQQNEQEIKDLQSKYDDVICNKEEHQAKINAGERQLLEARAKVQLVYGVSPLIDRISHEVKALETRNESDEKRAERREYIAELASQINATNAVLTKWIELRKGILSLHIESFAVEDVFNIVAKGKSAFKMKGVELCVEETNLVVKADRVLTMFMINTLADNARKAIEGEGKVDIYAKDLGNMVEISVADNGCGIEQDQLPQVFAHKISDGHGFGLVNCKGIIERYRKTSRAFANCSIDVESEKGRGSRFFFRLPKGVVRVVMVIVMLLSMVVSGNAQQDLLRAKAFADSAYFSNIAGTYSRTLVFADSCRKYLNRYYFSVCPKGKYPLLAGGNTELLAPEIRWYSDSVPSDYNTILDVRNETAVAALALHDWTTYNYNNKIYVKLFNEMSADSTLPSYCRTMLIARTNKTIALIMLVVVLLMILPAYYLLYYRHRLAYRACVARIDEINGILQMSKPANDKLIKITPLATGDYPPSLSNIVRQIIDELKTAADFSEQKQKELDTAEDDCRKAEYESNNLHVCNSVVDNCLSSLKHETMYYPSRILQLVDTEDIAQLEELVDYYRSLYQILSLQALREVERIKPKVSPIDFYGYKMIANENMLSLLMEILKKQNNRQMPTVSIEPFGDMYVKVTATMTNVTMSEQQVANIFTPSESNIPYLLCRQIMRDLSEATNRRACGISAKIDEGKVAIVITMPKYRTGITS